MKYPNIAQDIGQVSKGSNNISTVAARIAAQGASSGAESSILDARREVGSEGLGDEVGAFRHALWQAIITSKYGASIALEVGNAHEDDPNAKIKTSFSSLKDADQVIDLLNNMIGRDIGSQKGNTKDITIKVLDSFKEKGLWIAEKSSDDTWKLVKTTISEEKYTAMKSAINQKDNFGNWIKK